MGKTSSLQKTVLLAGGAVLAGSVLAARRRRGPDAAVTLLDNAREVGKADRAGSWLDRPIVQSPLPVGARILGRLMASAPDMSALASASETLSASPVSSLLLRVFTGFTRSGVRLENRSIAGRDGAIPIRVYTPERKATSRRPLVLEFHGGGWSLGDLDSADWISSTVASDLDAIVVSVDYRLSPQHRFPAGVNDCFDALKWCAAHMMELGADAERIGVMGESAGGNLAAVVSLMARDEGIRIHHQALVYPASHPTGTTRSRRANASAPVLDKRALDSFEYSYVEGNDVGQDWRLSPLHAPDKRGLPPALIQIGGHDPLYDDGLLYAKALVDAGVSVSLTSYAAMPHGFINMPYFCRDSKRAMREIVAEQGKYLKP